MGFISEQELEEYCLNWFQEDDMGYKYKNGKEIASRIMQLSYPDKYSYRFEWMPDTVLIVEKIELKEGIIFW